MTSGTISIRKFIRWLPDEASEPTSTVVLTSPQHRYVDLRILLTGEEVDAGSIDFGVLPLDRLDWAIAGVSSSKTRDDGQGGHISRSTFYHWVDSRTMDPEKATDEGDMLPREDGTTLETGSMVNPATGNEAEYEELWLDVDATSEMRCVVLKLENSKGARGMIVLLGNYCQGFMKNGEEGDEMAAERWELDPEKGWRRTVRMGDLELPCAEIIKDGKSCDIGDVLETGAGTWAVVEAVN